MAGSYATARPSRVRSVRQAGERVSARFGSRLCRGRAAARPNNRAPLDKRRIRTFRFDPRRAAGNPTSQNGPASSWPERREEHTGSKIGSTVIASMIDYGLEEGLSGISVCMNTFWLPEFHEYGWRVRPLGMPDVHDDEWLIAVLIDVTPAALAGIRTACGLEKRSALVRRGPQRAFILSRDDVAAVA